jgi:hypothetical protein
MFLTFIIGTPGSLSARARGLPLMFFNIDGGCSQISVSTSQGVHHRCFLALMVGALRFFVSTSQGPAIDIF